MASEKQADVFPLIRTSNPEPVPSDPETPRGLREGNFRLLPKRSPLLSHSVVIFHRLGTPPPFLIMKKLSLPSFLAATALVLNLPGLLDAAEMNLTIQSDFPGGNIVIEENSGSTVRLSPDLRTSKPWFYWYFAAKASQPGKVTFLFPPGKIAKRGPAFSLDEGKTWQWMGEDQVTYAKPKEEAAGTPPQDSFSFEFTKADQAVRFSMGFPYVQSNLDEFLKRNSSNPQMSQSVLATTLGGLPVELLQIGKPGEGTTAVLVAARSHACEALASYVLEGFLQEAISDSPTGIAFRKKYVLFAAPLLDKDGVQAGDQGKNREPHDHNRDYGTTNLYPEVKALQELGAKQNVRVAIDFHCPALRGDIHEAFHWLGLKIPHMSDNAAELSAWLGQERPPTTNSAISFLAEPPEPPKLDNIPFSWYFAYLNQSLLAITLESPYAQVQNVDTARAYGAGLLRALANTEFVAAGNEAARGAGSFAAFEDFQKKMAALINNPVEAEALANEILKDPAASPVYRAQADLGMANVRQRQKQFADALAYARAARAEAGATTAQKFGAHLAVIAIQARNTEATPADVDAALAEFEALADAGPADQFKAYDHLATYYEERGEFSRALAFHNKQLSTGADWQKSGTLLKIAGLLERMGQKEEAIDKRKEVVSLLRPLLVPTPKGRSIFLGINSGDLFDALNGIPTSTNEEKLEAANIIINYPTLPAGVKERAEKWIQENPAKTGA